MTADAEFEILVGDEIVATTFGPRDRALVDAMHYADQYGNEGHVTVWEVTRVKVWEDAP